MLRVVLSALLLASAGCKKHQPPKPDLLAEEVASLSSTILMGDPAQEGQLTSGFYGIEGNAWRWTQRRFSAVLDTPDGAARNGATLIFRFALVPQLVDELKTVSLRAKLGGKELPAISYSRKGDQIYRQPVPAAALSQDSVKVEFEVDKAFGPKPGDGRELGVVAVELALVEK